MAEFLRTQFMQFTKREVRRTHQFPSQADFAVWLDVSPTSLSYWMTEKRPPLGDNIDKLADKLGLEVYEILGVPPRLPNDKWMSMLAKRWHYLPESRKKYYFELVNQETEPEATEQGQTKQNSES